MINQGSTAIQAVGLWFIAVESYINNILKVSCMVLQKDFNVLKGKPIASRLKSIFEILDLSSDEFNRQGTVTKLKEYSSLRNNIFHDRRYLDDLRFDKTAFSPDTNHVNQVDIMQAMVIILEVMGSLRSCFLGLDLMPDIFTWTKDVSGARTQSYIKLDVMYADVIKPYFVRCLEKHSLSIDLCLDVKYSTVAASKKISNDMLKVIIKTHQNSNDVKTNDIKTNYYDDIKNNVLLKQRLIPEGCFLVPNYLKKV